MPWLLVLHQIPPKPPYFRAKILRRLAQVGALAVKNSAYLLPETEDTREDFEWIVREITNEGGAAWLFRADALSLSDAQIEESFRELRAADYEQIIASCRELMEGEAAAAEVAKLTHRFAEVKRIDFFEHPLRSQAASLLEQLQVRPRGGSAVAAASTGHVWVTRKGIKVDRIASAWLIRRFIDPHATFRFVDTGTYVHAPSELRFDMYEGEFTHVGDLCTFEVLIQAHHLSDKHPGLLPIAEMVHDIDLKDARYERPETNGLARMLDGLCGRTSDDLVRLEQGSQIFESLFQSFS